MSGITASVAASVMKPAPVTPEAPFEVSIATPRMVALLPERERRVPSAWARNRVASVM